MKKRLVFVLFFVCITLSLFSIEATRQSGNWYSFSFGYGYVPNYQTREVYSVYIEATSEQAAYDKARNILGEFTKANWRNMSIRDRNEIYSTPIEDVNISMDMRCDYSRYWNHQDSDRAYYKDVYYFHSEKKQLIQFVVKSTGRHFNAPVTELQTVGGIWYENGNRHWDDWVSYIEVNRPDSCVPRQSEAPNTLSAPQSLSVVPGVEIETDDDKGFIEVTWQNNHTYDNVEIQQMSRTPGGSNGNWQTIGRLSGNTTTYRHNECYSNREYAFRVRNRSNDGQLSDWSSSSRFILNDYAPGIRAERIEIGITEIKYYLDTDWDDFSSYSIQVYKGSDDSNRSNRIINKTINRQTPMGHLIYLNRTEVVPSQDYLFVIEGTGADGRPDNFRRQIIRTNDPVINKTIRGSVSSFDLKISSETYFASAYPNIICKPYLDDGTVSTENSTYVSKRIPYNRFQRFMINPDLKYEVTVRCTLQHNNRSKDFKFDFESNLDLSALTELNTPSVSLSPRVTTPLTPLTAGGNNPVLRNDTPVLPAGKAKKPAVTINQPQYKVRLRVYYLNKKTKDYYKTVTAPNTRIAGDTAKKQLIKSLGNTKYRKISVISTAPVTSKKSSTKSIKTEKTTGTSTLKKK